MMVVQNGYGVRKTHVEMATAEKLDASIGHGIKSIKTTMKDISQKIKATNERAERLENENQSTRTVYAKSYGRQKAMGDRKIMLEERLEKSEDKIKEISRRVQEKEQFAKESKQFHNSLQVTAPNEGEVFEMEEKLRIHKELYAKNYEKYQIARNKKVELEQEFERVEIKAHESLRRMAAIRTELEYSLSEEARRTEACKGAIDAAFRCEKNCLDLQSGLDVIMKRKDAANKNIQKLEREVTKAENSLETLQFERKRAEATIKEMLINIKSQRT